MSTVPPPPVIFKGTND